MKKLLSNFLNKRIIVPIVSIIRSEAIINSYKLLNIGSKSCLLNKIKRKNEIVISLTSFGNRVNDVFLVIESIANQTLLADKVVLWLSEEEYNDNNLPITLVELKKRGLTINYTHDIKSYKKLIPTLKACYNSIIITIDDDTIYDTRLIEFLYTSHLKTPNAICCMVAREIENKNNEISSYSNWKLIYNDRIGHSIIGIGAGGILYPKGCFHEDVLKEELFMNLAPRADDLWFKLMALRKGTPYKYVNTVGLEYRNTQLKSTHYQSLMSENVAKNLNDEQFNKIINYFSITISSFTNEY